MTRSYVIEAAEDDEEPAGRHDTTGRMEKEKKTARFTIYTVMVFNDFHLRMTKHQSPVATYLLNNDSIDAIKVSFDAALCIWCCRGSIHYYELN